MVSMAFIPETHIFAEYDKHSIFKDKLINKSIFKVLANMHEMLSSPLKSIK